MGVCSPEQQSAISSSDTKCINFTLQLTYLPQWLCYRNTRTSFYIIRILTSSLGQDTIIQSKDLHAIFNITIINDMMVKKMLSHSISKISRETLQFQTTKAESTRDYMPNDIKRRGIKLVIPPTLPMTQFITALLIVGLKKAPLLAVIISEALCLSVCVCVGCAPVVMLGAAPPHG